jgi:hypothetical protein
MKDKFKEHLKRCAETVKKWPKWKRDNFLMLSRNQSDYTGP